MTPDDVIDEHVARRLEAWGRTYANNIAPRDRKITAQTARMEMVVRDLEGTAPAVAVAMRAYFCGSGRRGVERLEQAQAGMQRKGLPWVNKRDFFNYVRRGFGLVRERLVGLEGLGQQVETSSR